MLNIIIRAHDVGKPRGHAMSASFCAIKQLTCGASIQSTHSGSILLAYMEGQPPSNIVNLCS